WRMIIIGMSHFIELDFKNRLFEHLLLLSNSFFGRIKTGDIMAHMTNDPQDQVFYAELLIDIRKKSKTKPLSEKSATSSPLLQ
ncbi:hypothetical protein KJ813_08375, partial [bacterium]|nr:hypothetical protein [bacterium]MBU4362657.1 hypothetical protein [bacterium]MBU4601618.1 hypothetical protein [bacterium]